MIRTLLMPAELCWRASPRRWVAVVGGLAVAGAALVFIGAPYLDANLDIDNTGSNL